MNAELITGRVAKGVALLDEREPSWWRVDRLRPIDLNELSLVDPCGCPLGQTWDGDEIDPFDAHARELLGGDAWTRFQREVEHGFNAEDDDDDEVEYDQLTAEWRKVITERRAGAQ